MSSTEQSLDEDFLVQFDYSFRYGDSKQVHFINTFDWFTKVSCHTTLMKMIIHDNWKRSKINYNAASPDLQLQYWLQNHNLHWMSTLQQIAFCHSKNSLILTLKSQN